ncbi:MAG TPA: hypothetical protein VFE62_19915, partial [Gemmataceae bacterium]|nr:hypothetical protein [Gemmataceae bacterium]
MGVVDKSLKPGDAVRTVTVPHEMTVCQRDAAGFVQCVWFPGNDLFAGDPEEAWFHESDLVLTWKNFGPFSVEPGDRVQLSSGGPYMTRGVESNALLPCAWFCGNDLHFGTFPTQAVIRDRISCGRTGWAKPGDPVRLRSGGPLLTVVATGNGEVTCATPVGHVTFDESMMVLDLIESGEQTTREILAYASERGYDLNFSLDGVRFVSWWRDTSNGPFRFRLQGMIQPGSPAAGIRGEAGCVDTIEEAFELTKALLLDRLVLERLPFRESMTKWDG